MVEVFLSSQMHSDDISNGQCWPQWCAGPTDQQDDFQCWDLGYQFQQIPMMQPHIPLPPMAPYPQSADANLLQWMNPMMAQETFVESPEVSWHHQQQHQQHILNSQQARAGNCGKLFVGGLPATCGNEELREYFGKFGSIVDCVVMYDKENRHRGFGFVTFATAKEKEAVMSGYEKHYIGRKWIEVKRCIPKDDMDVYRPAQPDLQRMPLRAKELDGNFMERTDAFSSVNKPTNDSFNAQDRVFTKIVNLLGSLRETQESLSKKLENLKKVHGGSSNYHPRTPSHYPSTYGTTQPPYNTRNLNLDSPYLNNPFGDSPAGSPRY